MSIIRTSHHLCFAPIVVNSKLLADSNPLSWEAIGLLIYLLSKPDNWQGTIASLTNVEKCGSREIGSILEELKQEGYIVVKRHSSGKYEYYVYDTPQEQPEQEEGVVL